MHLFVVLLSNIIHSRPLLVTQVDCYVCSIPPATTSYYPQTIADTLEGHFYVPWFNDFEDYQLFSPS